MNRKHLFLTGFRGSGKSSVAKQLANMLQLPMVDLDDEIERAAGKSIKDIFAEVGEQGFRDQETTALRRVVNEPRSIISLGGGAILRSENRECIKQNGVCVWLKVDAVTAEARLYSDPTTRDRRPSLTHLDWRKEIETQIELRTPMYEAASDFIVDTTGQSLEMVVDAIVVWFARGIEK